MKHLPILALMAMALPACGDEPTHVFFGEPSDSRLEGSWAGKEEIRTMQDNNAFSFPVLLQLDDDGRFTLFTTNYPASYDNEMDRTCSGAYTRSGNSVAFFPSEACRALPLTKFTLGRVLPDGVTLEARSPNPSYASIRVFFWLERD